MKNTNMQLLRKTPIYTVFFFLRSDVLPKKRVVGRMSLSSVATGIKETAIRNTQ